MALVGLTVISGCNRVDEQRTGTQAHAISSVPRPQTSATPKYLEGQRVKLGNETVVVVFHKCVPETGCEYEVYFMADSEAAVRERREVKKSWVKESELGSVVPAFEIGQRVYFTAEPQSTGYITHSACNSGRCRYTVNYVDKNGIHHEAFAEEFELSTCRALASPEPKRKCL